MMLVSLIMLVSPTSFGRVQKARLLPGLKNQTAWMFNQTNATECLCNAQKKYTLSNIAALNSFSANKSCQLILSPPVLSLRIVSDSGSTLILLQLLNDAPCCSDLTWLLDRIKNSAQQSKTKVTKPGMISINPPNTFLSTLIYRSDYVRIHRHNMTMEGIYSLPSGYTCASSIYRRGYIFFGKSYSYYK